MDTTFPEPSFIEVDGRRMAYREAGEGPAIVLLHGNPTSSFLWRHVWPHLVPHGRCIAPDLIGMGHSDKLPDPGPGTYRYGVHREYLFGLLEHLDLGDDVTLVIHDWGSALGFDWASQHPDRTRAIAYMEAIVQPVTWEDWPEAARDIFQAFRGEAGEKLILDKNLFVDAVLPASIQRKLTDEEMDAYRAPFAEREARWPTLQWPREIPIDGEPADVHDIVAGYAQAMATSDDLPKLFINADPGSILIGPQREFCRTWPNQREVTVPGLHFIQEDSGDAIGRHIADFLESLA